jgi:hypothetical protein
LYAISNAEHPTLAVFGMQARAILPSVPYINMAIVHSCMTGIFADILVGNFMSGVLPILSMPSKARGSCSFWVCSSERQLKPVWSAM